jgi:alpha-galactosidase
MAQTLRLDGGGETLVLRADAGPPRLVYWGAALPAGEGEAGLAGLAERAIGVGVLDDGEALDLAPEAARGFTGQPAIEVHRPSGGFLTQLAFVAARPVHEGWEIALADPLAGVELTQTVTLDAASGVAAFRARLVNAGDEPLAVSWLAPAALPLAHDEVLAFDGRWGHEFQPTRQRVATGLFVKDNRTGRTSHHAPPFLVVGAAGFGEHAGEVLGLHLAWSGNARMLVERLRDGRLQAQGGELFLPGELTLAPGEAYETPILYAARSDGGLNGLSARLHPFVRGRIFGGRLAAKPRPVHFNTWEAVYFRHDLAELKALADVAASVGAERYVLDDGWFEGRSDDTTSLGDWRADPIKYPQGLGPLIDHVRGLGMEFGLWVEPEMANAQSALLREHPDWTLHAPGRVQPLGRGQYVLDLTRAEVADHIFGQLHALLSAHPIGYLKWDMNRDLTHAMSGGRPAAHRQMRAAYALIDRLRAAHPGVEIESCASGGGRMDYEVLTRTDRFWTSDCHDPLERQAIQRGASIFFPPEVLGAHVGASPDHTTGRRSSIEFRALTTFFGSMGIEADVRAFSERELKALKGWIETYKTHRALIHGGRLVRQVHGDPGAVATMVVGDGEALASFAQLTTPQLASPDPLRLVGLDPLATWRVRLINPPRPPGVGMRRAPALVSGLPVEASGRAIASLGLPLPILRPGRIALFHLERV